MVPLMMMPLGLPPMISARSFPTRGVFSVLKSTHQFDALGFSNQLRNSGAHPAADAGHHRSDHYLLLLEQTIGLQIAAQPFAIGFDMGARGNRTSSLAILFIMKSAALTGAGLVS